MASILGNPDGTFRVVDSSVDGTYQNYFVVKGDTLSKIAKAYDTTVAVLVEANNIKNPDLIEIGQRVLVPVKAVEVKKALEPSNVVAKLREDGTYDVTCKGFSAFCDKYVVVKGDTLGKIAAKFDTKVETLVKLNGIENPDLIEIDQVIYYPHKRT